MSIALLIVIAALGVVTLMLWRRFVALRRDQFIRNTALPTGLLDRLAKRRPELSLKQRVLVARGLRQFFLAYLHSGCRFVAMPSQVVDDLWHEFILYTKHYDQFCRQAFGRFLHHTPAVVLSAERRNNVGLRRVWWYACKEENIHPRRPSRLPLLFALDSKLGITDGFVYRTDCRRQIQASDGTTYCGGDFGSSEFDGSTAGFGDGDAGESGSGSTGGHGGDGGSDSGGGGDGGGGGDSGGGGCGGGCGGGD